MCMQSSRKFRQIFQFGFVGILNTIVGYTIILIALWFGFNDISANVSGYAIGLALSFLLNSRWTFGGMTATSISVVARYLIAFAFSYTTNLIVILELRSTHLLSSWAVHLVGIGIYTILFYITSKYFVFSKNATTLNKNDTTAGMKSGST